MPLWDSQMAKRITNNVQRGAPLELTVDGKAVSACAGETLATVLLAESITTFNRTAAGSPRAPYCNMGTCFECQVQVCRPGETDHRWVRACMCPVMDGMSVLTGVPLPAGSIDHAPN